MYCLKCGKEIPEKQAFCDCCLTSMEKYPVKPDTHILLPNRSTPQVVKKAANRRKEPTMKERLARTKTAVKWLSIALAVTVFALSLSVTLLVDTLKSKATNNTIGQNYNTVDTFDNAG